VISFNANTFTAKNVEGARQQPTYDTNVFLDLGAGYAKSLYGSNGFIKTLTDGTVTTDIPRSGGLMPSLRQQLYLDKDTNVSSSFIPNPMQQFLISPLPLKFIPQQAMACYGGTLNIGGRSGDALTQYL
jgi:hypothetical protein